MRSKIDRVRKALPELIPNQGVVKGAEKAVILVVGLLAALIGYDTQTGLGWVWDTLLGLLIGLVGFRILVWLGELAVKAAAALPARMWAIFGVGLYTAVEFWGLKDRLVTTFSAAIIAAVMLLGGAVTALRREIGNPWRKGAVWATVVVSSAAILTVVWWVATPGTDAHLLDIPPNQKSPTILSPDPSLPGPYAVLTLTYGSGDNPRRPEYGEQADIISRTASVRSYMRLDKFETLTREWYWGFGLENFPLNGRVWYPDGEGRFPLVLIVHGNHSMDDYSDTGYDYLGELLASRGYIFVSVDENFFNGYFSGRVSGENDARAWILLQHLGLWESWDNGLDSTPFAGLVDMENIALMGHSRGGEAATLAAVFNGLSRNPSNATTAWNFGYSIKSVVAIAPSDQQHLPAGQPAPLTDVNYLILQGAHDGDISTYSGLRQYQRVSFTDLDSGQFKAGLYIYQANHGQFNTSWGRRDLGIPRGWLLNAQPLMAGEAQRQIAKVYISAFLDATLKDKRAYIPLFQDYQAAGNWLPPTLYINQYESAGTQYLATFEEDIDVTTATVTGGSLSGVGLTRWREDELDFRTGREQENQVVLLGWRGGRGSYRVGFTPLGFMDDWQVRPEDILVFSLADGREDEIDDLLDFHIILQDTLGNESKIILSEVMPLMPQFVSQFTKFPAWEEDRYENAREPVMQSYRIPLGMFLEDNPELDLNSVWGLIFQFDISTNGKIILDNIGIEKP